MNSEFVEGWAIAQTLGEGTFGEYVSLVLKFIIIIDFNLTCKLRRHTYTHIYTILCLINAQYINNYITQYKYVYINNKLFFIKHNYLKKKSYRCQKLVHYPFGQDSILLLF